MHTTRGLCRLHYKRWRINGDPAKKSRFATQAEKDAFVAADIAARRERRAVEREQREYERGVERQRRQVLAEFDRRPVGPDAVALVEFDRRPVGPDAVALVEALDSLNEDDRARVASAFVTALLGRPVDLSPPSPPSKAESAEGATP